MKKYFLRTLQVLVKGRGLGVRTQKVRVFFFLYFGQNNRSLYNFGISSACFCKSTPISQTNYHTHYLVDSTYISMVSVLSHSHTYPLGLACRQIVYSVPTYGQRHSHTYPLGLACRQIVYSVPTCRQRHSHTYPLACRQIVLQKLEWKGQPKVDSLVNVQHRPGGGTVRVESQRLQFRRQASSKVGSRDNIHHKPGGGDVKVSA